MASKDRIPSNLRALLILEVLGRSDHAMTATEISHALCLPKQTVHELSVLQAHVLDQTKFCVYDLAY